MIPHGTAHDRATAIAGLAVALVVLVSCGAAAPAGPTAEPLDGTYTASGGRGAPDLRGLCLRRSDRHLRQECDPADRGRGDAGCCELVPRLDRDCQHRFSNRK